MGTPVRIKNQQSKYQDNLVNELAPSLHQRGKQGCPSTVEPVCPVAGLPMYSFHGGDTNHRVSCKRNKQSLLSSGTLHINAERRDLPPPTPIPNHDSDQAYMIVQPYKGFPHIAVSKMLPINMTTASWMIPHLRPIQSPASHI